MCVTLARAKVAARTIARRRQELAARALPSEHNPNDPICRSETNRRGSAKWGRRRISQPV